MNQSTESYQFPKGDLLPIAVRAYLEGVPDKDRKPPSRKSSRRSSPRPLRMMVIDTETVTQETLANPELMPGFNPDEWLPHTQPLMFGCAHLWTRKQNSRKWKRESEWTFYPDNLPVETQVKLRRHFSRDNLRVGDWREPKDSPGVKAYFIPLSEFLAIFYREAISPRCLLTGYNLPFDLSRLAYRVGPARSDWFRGGFSFVLWPDPTGKHPQNLYRPKFYAKQLGQRSTTMRFSTVRLGPNDKAKFHVPKCEPLDLSQFCFALLGESLSLDRAAKALGLKIGKAQTPGHGIITLDYFRYNRIDTLVTADIAFAAMDRFDKHPISREHNPPGPLSEIKVYSGASIAKAYLKLMGITPRMKLQPNFPRKALVAAMESYYGGRTESRIWGMPMACAPLDFVSQYPTVAHLQNLWQMVTAEKIKIERCTGKIRKLIKNIKIDDLYKSETWPLLNGFVKIKPRGEILPARAKYADGGSWKIGNNPYFSETEQWFPIADLVAAKIRNPEINPEIIEAFRLIPEGIQPDLKPVDFAGTLTIDPNDEDFFSQIVEERARIKQGLNPYKRTPFAELEAMSSALKIMANAGCYGVFAEVNKKDLAANATEILNLWTSKNTDDPQAITTHYPEHGGIFFFPPFASLVTAGGRLQLAMLQVEAESRGASYVLCDTDSMFITYKSDGGVIEIAGADAPIRLLDDDEINEIINRFNSINFYDPEVIPHLLKREYLKDWPLLVLSIGPKRYAIFNTSGKVIAYSESALGAIIPPTDNPEWMRVWWSAIGSGDRLPFGDGPLVRKYSVRTWETYNHFRALNKGRPYQEQIKPFNFLISAQPDSFMTGPDASPLVGPFEQNPEVWESLPWFKTQTGDETSITLDLAEAMEASNKTVCIQTIGNYFNRYKSFKPAEFNRPENNQPGLLKLRPIERASLTLVGKESNPFEELAEGNLIKDEPLEVPVLSSIQSGGTLLKQTTPASMLGRRAPVEWLERIAPILKELDSASIIKISEQRKVIPRTVRRWANMDRKPADRFRRPIEAFCIRHAEQVLKGIGIPIPEHKPNVMAVYTGIVPEIRAAARERLETYTEDFGPVAAAREFKINRRTVPSWVDHPERIPIHKAVEIAGTGINKLTLRDPTETIQVSTV